MVTTSDAITLRVLDKRGIPVTGVKYELLESANEGCFGVIQREADDSSAVVFHRPDNEDTICVRASRGAWSETRTFQRNKVQYDFRSDLVMPQDDTQKLMYWSFGVGVIFALLLLLLSSLFPTPSSAQRQIWQAILSVALAAFANGILGLLEVNVNIPRIGLTIRAVGAIAIAIIVFFFVPAFA